eukprot:CAMPEP_0113610874 /NCGR_PEP_ID=MMETSP0017_2-20120614/5256_1 /TAXON_ID=2856 /ORGANISM="Cylindrotheca closterium" /LENGTH=996 /DNA_ID=CAMNT_0000519785 /DNA_START=125 /DNA_END=3115 /DNA_ORIENTATION=+ /assembly_acc=CAM_ASM_000147
MTVEGTSTDISNYYESICYANAVKKDKSEKVGLVVKRSNAWNTLYISGIKDTSKFAGSKLEIGMVILTINGMKCPTTVKEIQKVMKETEGDLTIMAATISKEITIVGSNANSPTRSPAHSPVRPTNNTPKSNDSETAATVDGSEDHALESLEMTLSGHQQKYFRKISDNDDDDDDEGRPRRVSPPDSPGNSLHSSKHERKVSDSGLRDSPVSISSIDHTGNIVVTPVGSPKNTVTQEVASKVQMPKLVPPPAREDEKKEEVLAAADDSAGSSQEKQQMPQQAEETSRQSAEPEADTKLPASPLSTTSASSKRSKRQQQQKEDEKAKERGRRTRLPGSTPGATTSARQQRQQQEDDNAKNRGRAPRLAPAVEPGAFHVATRPNAGSKNARSLSPVPTRPGAHRVAGINSRISEPSIRTLPNMMTLPSLATAGGGSSSSANRAAAAAAAQPRTMGKRNESLSPPRMRPENLPPPHPDLRQPGAHRMAGPNRRGDRSLSPMNTTNNDDSKQGYGGPVDVDDLENDDEQQVLQGIGVGMGIPINENPSFDAKDPSEYCDDDDDDQFSIEVSEAPDMSIITSDDLVIAAEVHQENPQIVEERIRKQILQETAQAAVVMVEHGGNPSDGPLQEEELEKHRPKNVKEKLFGGGGTGRDVSQEISVTPDRFIRKREYLPWTVQQNKTTNMWIASVVTDQKAYDEGNKTEQERSKAVFSAKTEREAHETGLAMATPYLQPFKSNPICVMCSSKFAVFNRPHNCRNCGVVVCSKCTVIWSSKRFPSTYQASKSTHSVCLACDWSANNFQEAVLQGNLMKAKKLYESGNVNLRSPYISSKKKSAQEIMYPIHMAILGCNVALARWLCKERYVPVTTEIKSKGKLKSLPIGTSKGRTPLKLAIKQKDHDMLKFLVAEVDVSLFDEDIKGDYRWILAHLSNTLHRAPYEYEIAKKKRNATNGSSQASSPKSSHGSIGGAAITVATNGSHGSSSRAGSRGESRADSLAEV